MINYVVIDDEPAAIEVLKIHLSKLPFMILKATYRDPLEALEYLQNESIDLIFLDINMPQISGISFPKLLKNPPLIIFTTAYSEYALASYELNAVDYLLKPIEFDRLLQAVLKAKSLLEPSAAKVIAEPSSELSDQTIFIKSGADYHQLAISAIKYVESDGNYVTFFTDQQKLVARYKISEVLELLPKQHFARIHRSFIVALKKLDIVKKHCVIIDGVEVPISTNYREDFLSMIEGLSK